LWITLPAPRLAGRGKGAPSGARPQADLPCGGRFRTRYTPRLSLGNLCKSQLQ